MEEKIFQRKQFTFYESFYHCIEKTLRKKSEKLTAYKALIQYALYGDIEEKENLSDAVLGILEAFYPILNTAREKAKGGKTGGMSKHACEKSESKKENKIENKIEIKSKSENKNKGNAADFKKFWEAYPKKVGKLDAERVFNQIEVPLSILLQALQKQKTWPQWTREQGRFIPNPAKWLRNGGWNDEAIEADEPMGELELQAIRRMMENPNGFS